MPLSCWRSRVLADGSLEEYLVPSEDNNITYVACVHDYNKRIEDV
jgi:hypothetical protein